MTELDKLLPLLTEQERGVIVEEGHSSGAHGGKVGLGWCRRHIRPQASCYQEEYVKAQRAADVRNLVAWLRAEAVELEQRLSLNRGYDLAASSIRVRADRLEAMLNTAEKR